jgi:hypothetical protein
VKKKWEVPEDEKVAWWDIKYDLLGGFELMRTVRKRFLTIRVWHVWMALLVLGFASWGGIFMLGFYVRDLLGGLICR